FLTTSAIASSNVGSSPITPRGAVSTHFPYTTLFRTLTVTTAALTIAADDKSKVYGATLPALTASYSGFVNGDSASSLSSPVVLSTSASVSSNVGSYPITPSGAASANYSLSFIPGTLTITTAALTITADDKSKVYGAALPALTASYSGFVNGDSASTLSSPVVLSTSASASSNVGSYPITPSGAASANYSLSFVPGTLTITTAALTITADDKSKVYGAALPALTASYS